MDQLKGIIWIKGPYNLVIVSNLEILNNPGITKGARIKKLADLKSRFVKLSPTSFEKPREGW